jgi:hypothetical protein
MVRFARHLTGTNGMTQSIDRQILRWDFSTPINVALRQQARLAHQLLKARIRAQRI